MSLEAIFPREIANIIYRMAVVRPTAVTIGPARELYNPQSSLRPSDAYPSNWVGSKCDVRELYLRRRAYYGQEYEPVPYLTHGYLPDLIRRKPFLNQIMALGKYDGEPGEARDRTKSRPYEPTRWYRERLRVVGL
jgi:hypothetical protein